MDPSGKSPPKFATLALITALPVLSLNIYLPSLPSITADLQADYGLVSFSISGYLFVTAVLQLVIGSLSDRFGRRPVLLVCIGAFILASIGCYLATDIWAFLLMRMLQGAIIAGSALARAVIRDTRGPQEAASLIGYVGMAMAVAPMIAPLVGGVLDEFFGWRATFMALSGLGILTFIVCWIDLAETNSSKSATLKAQFRTYPELMASRKFWGFVLCMAFSQGAFYSFLAGAPLAAGSAFNLPPATLGILMGATAAGFILGSFISGRFAKNHALSTMMVAGRITACIGLTAGFIFLAAGIHHPFAFFGAAIFLGIGNGITLPSANAGALSVQPHLIGSASGLAGALGISGGALMMTITSAVISELPFFLISLCFCLFILRHILLHLCYTTCANHAFSTM